MAGFRVAERAVQIINRFNSQLQETLSDRLKHSEFLQPIPGENSRQRSFQQAAGYAGGRIGVRSGHFQSHDPGTYDALVSDSGLKRSVGDDCSHVRPSLRSLNWDDIGTPNLLQQEFDVVDRNPLGVLGI